MVYDLLNGAQEQSSKAVFLFLEIGQLCDCVVGGVGVPPRSLLQAAASRPTATFCLPKTSLNLASGVTPLCPPVLFGGGDNLPPGIE